jgi:hypothetical protein
MKWKFVDDIHNIFHPEDFNLIAPRSNKFCWKTTFKALLHYNLWRSFIIIIYFWIIWGFSFLFFCLHFSVMRELHFILCGLKVKLFFLGETFKKWNNFLVKFCCCCCCVVLILREKKAKLNKETNFNDGVWCMQNCNLVLEFFFFWEQRSTNCTVAAVINLFFCLLLGFLKKENAKS